MSTSARLGFLYLILTVMLLLANGAQAQSYKILHFFAGQLDGSTPTDSPTLDAAGNLYGTATGNVFKFSPQPDGTWIETVLTSGVSVYGNVIFDKEANLYGATLNGGAFGGGIVFKLSPNPDGTWVRTTLHNFAGSPDDGSSSFAGVVFDAAGNLYGATCGGGTSGNGTVYQLKPERDGSWTEKVLYSFQGGADGSCPFSSPTFDGARNNLYGITAGGGANAQCSGCGTVFQLLRSQNWKESVLHSFTGGSDGRWPFAGLTWARPDALFGTTSAGGISDGGTIFQMVRARNIWTKSVIHTFSGADGASSQSDLVLDGRNLYGTTSAGGMGRPDAFGTVFKLEFSNGQWTERVLHNFGGPPHDGGIPMSGVALRRDATGLHIFGMTWRGGPSEQCFLGCGVVYEITR
jgi:uncharacterized repeat protein (TIGR03803 family)